MSNFKVGQKVVCINPIYDLIKNEIYTIITITQCACKDVLVELSEHNKKDIYEFTLCSKCKLIHKNPSLFSSTRFRPLDHAFADEVEAMIKEQVKQEQLETV